MEYLDRKEVEVYGHKFEIQELSLESYEYVIAGPADEPELRKSLRAVARGVPAFMDKSEDEIARAVSGKIVAQLASEIIDLSSPDTDELEKNSESTRPAGLSSV